MNAPHVETCVRIGSAGWALRSEHKRLFSQNGSHLEQYSQVFNCVEINSSFYQPHGAKTYQRWSRTVPPNFRFSVKMPQLVTHQNRLTSYEGVPEFLEQVSALEEKLGPVLVQLPPSLEYSREADIFFNHLRADFSGAIACEPRHKSWFTKEVAGTFTELHIARVAADPAIIAAAALPGGDASCIYYRLHGSPKMYYSTYRADFLEHLAQNLAQKHVETWCIFDNTAMGYATLNALQVTSRLKELNAEERIAV